ENSVFTFDVADLSHADPLPADRRMERQESRLPRDCRVCGRADYVFGLRLFHGPAYFQPVDWGTANVGGPSDSPVKEAAKRCTSSGPDGGPDVKKMKCNWR